MVTTSSGMQASAIVCPKPNSRARLRLFCFPYAGVGASVFCSLWKDLSEDIEVCSVQYPGRESRRHEPLASRMEELLESIAPSVREHNGMQFAFFGHSLGALVCFELAQFLRRAGERMPVHLLVSGRTAPQIADQFSCGLDSSDAEILENLQRFDGTPAQVMQDPALMRFFLPVIRADLNVISTYEYRVESPLDCSISAFGGLEDHTTNRERIEAWRYQTSSSFKCIMLPGKHFFIHSARTSFVEALEVALNDHVSCVGGPQS